LAIEDPSVVRVLRFIRENSHRNLRVADLVAAAASGFEVDAHVAGFFSRRTGVTPLAYRKKMRIF
jgi:transcriptional regulator GlxA family with amidase domain